MGANKLVPLLVIKLQLLCFPLPLIPTNGLPNGATEAFIKYEQDLTLNDVFYSVNYAMTHDEWVEYCNITKAQ